MFKDPTILGHRRRRRPNPRRNQLLAIIGLAGGLLALLLWPTQPPAPEAEATTVTAHAKVTATPEISVATTFVGPPSPWRVFEGTIERDQTLGAALAVLGVQPSEVHRLVRAFTGVFDFRHARPGARFTLRLDQKTRHIHSFRFELGALEVYEATVQDGALTARAVEVKTDTRTTTVSAQISSSLARALRSAGEGPVLIGLMVDVFAWDLDFYKDPKRGDTFKVIVEKIYKDDTFISYGRILAAQYSGEAGDYRVFYFERGPGDGDYFLADGRSARKTFLATPLKYVRVSSAFNKRRRHPILGYTRAHNGVDFAAPTGTPVRAMADGEVVFAGRKGANGNLVVLRHKGQIKSYYAHLHRIASKLKRGMKVKQKQVIGAVGSTGRSTGPHLHFGVKVRGRYIDPQNFKTSRAAPLAPAYHAAFEMLRTQRQAQLDAI